MKTISSVTELPQISAGIKTPLHGQATPIIYQSVHELSFSVSD